jgi:hypothetical protein
MTERIMDLRAVKLSLDLRQTAFDARAPWRADTRLGSVQPICETVE